jgi:DNA-nicking Smr family endonuclease
VFIKKYIKKMPRSAYDDTFDELRAQSKFYADQKNQYMQLSRQAYERGDKKEAKALSNKGKQLKSLMDKENQAAASNIFVIHNANKNENEIDLHGLFVTEAIDRLNRRVEQARKSGEHELIVIVGRGIHSEGGPKIKPAVIKYATKNKIEHQLNSPNAGCITFEFDGNAIASRRIKQRPRNKSTSRSRSKSKTRQTQQEIRPNIRPTPFTPIENRPNFYPTVHQPTVYVPRNYVPTIYDSTLHVPRNNRPTSYARDDPVFITMPAEARRSNRQETSDETENSTGSTWKTVLKVVVALFAVAVIASLFGFI